MKSSTRPLLTYTVLIVIVMVGLGVLLAQVTRSYFANVFEERVKVESQYFATYLESYSDDNHIDHKNLYSFSKRLNTGMVWVSDNGEVVMDTIESIPMISEEKKLTILDQVFSGQVNNREGKHIDDLFFYPVSTKIDETTGTLVIITPVQALSEVTRNIWLLIGFTLLLGLIAIYIIGFNVFSKYIRPIRSAANVATELAKGNYKVRTYERQFGEAGQLNRSINILAENLQEMTSTKGVQESQLEAVINNMGNGLVLIDEKGYIRLINRAFLENFGGVQHNYVNYLYHDAIPYTAVQETVKKIYMFEETTSEVFVLPLKIDRKHLNVTGAPIFSEDKSWKGIVLVFHDISELKQLEQMRKDFVANVSHELKTPITSIRGFSETLIDGAKDDTAMLNQFLQIILKESGRLQSLIEDLLELSKLERDDFHLNIEQLDIQKLLYDLFPIVKQRSDQENISLNTEVKGQTMIQGDSSRLKQVFMNLLTNAVNYTPAEGAVSVLLNETAEHVIISVQDNGVGIPIEEIPRVFERFYRVDKARSRNSGGTGLGLAIVKHIIEAHKGKIHVESTVGEGTTFIVEIPKRFTEN